MDGASTALEPIDETLFAHTAPLQLAGSGCGDCGVVVFPAVKRCPACAGLDVERRGLPTRGTVWTWTTQSFAPKPPYQQPDSGFEPFTVGYVDLGGVLVESRILGSVDIGDEVELSPLAVSQTEFTFAFEKVQ